jgi:ABC-2 type transport system permease protein
MSTVQHRVHQPMTAPSMRGPLSSQQWAHLAATGLVWLVIPLALGLRLVVRAEVK